MRKLASIQKITKLVEIPGCDRIELAIVLGWQCIVSKSDKFKEGDLVVFFEPDSILPDRPEFEFMRPRKFRVRTIKMRGQLSQGLVMPIMAVARHDKKGSPLDPNFCETVLEEDTDVTEYLGVTKYDPEALQETVDTELIKVRPWKITKKFLRYKWFRSLYKFINKKSDDFPSFLKKTDEVRIQACPSILKYNVGVSLIGTEKLDGQSATFALTKKGAWWPKSKFYVCSRNKLLLKPDRNSKYWQSAMKYDLKAIMRKAGGEICIQGEQCGPGIQGNKYGLIDVELYVFDIWDLRTGRRYTYDEIAEFCNKYKLTPVTKVTTITISDNSTPEDFVKMADQLIHLTTTTPAEGIVFRAKDWNKNRVSFKAVSREFEVKYGG